MRNVSLSELLLVIIIFLLVMTATRVGRLGETIAARFATKRPKDDPRIGVRERDGERGLRQEVW